MANKQNIDEKIAKLVQSIEVDIPAQVEEKFRASAESIRPIRKIRMKRVPIFVGITASAAMILIFFLFLFPMFQNNRESQITEIRTELELVDKNIKIIFIQRPDFSFFKEEK